MSRTFRKREISWSSPRILQEKRPKQHLQADIEEELRLVRSPLLKWERERAKNYQIPCN